MTARHYPVLHVLFIFPASFCTVIHKRVQVSAFPPGLNFHSYLFMCERKKKIKNNLSAPPLFFSMSQAAIKIRLA